ncbi:MAG: hypothetical protein KAJ40_05895, partial [Alphaproteobacteria bacterium]|nr:hypothetical protein [Alphaproteobacteria bacterium]
RVAQLSSDHIWLWSRGYDGGGPHAELLRRIVHWLMKEPELDERAFDVRVNKDQITVKKQSFGKSEETISVQMPGGEVNLATLKLNEQDDTLSYRTTAQELGIYAFQDVQGMRKFAIIGDINPPELSGVITTPDLMAPLIKASGGTSIWIADTPHPTIRSYKKTHNYGEKDWLALRQNGDFTIMRVKDIALLSEWLSLLILFSALLFLWWKEGQN